MTMFQNRNCANCAYGKTQQGDLVMGAEIFGVTLRMGLCKHPIALDRTNKMPRCMDGSVTCLTARVEDGFCGPDAKTWRYAA